MSFHIPQVINIETIKIQRYNDLEGNILNFIILKFLSSDKIYYLIEIDF